MAAAPDAVTGWNWARIAQAAKTHPLFAVISVLGTIATFIVGSVRVTGIVLGATTSPIGQTIPPGTLGLPTVSSYRYISQEDATGRIEVDIPTTWVTTPGNGWHAHNLPPIPEDRVLGPGLNATPDLAAWGRSGEFETPGVFVGASQTILHDFTPERLLQDVSFADCTKSERTAYANSDFTGEIVVWSCRGRAQWRVLAATPKKSEDYLVYLQVKLVTSADVEAYNRILKTFKVRFDA
jgi:hypothetical protein